MRHFGRDNLIAFWAVAAGAAFTASPFVAERFPEALDILVAAGRACYVIGLAAVVIETALRILRRRLGTDKDA
ncbi:MAG: hypothetical protein ACP5R5_04330 [Armatimonadota bacterium]